MKELTIEVHGAATVAERADFAILSIAVSSEGPSQEVVSGAVKETSNDLQAELASLSGDDQAPVSSYSMTALNTMSYLVRHHGEPRRSAAPPEQRQFKASINFSVTFRRFETLADVITILMGREHVGINGIDWRLTEQKQNHIGSQCRKQALRDAMRKAEDYAEVLGRAILPVQIVAERTHSHSRGLTRAMVMDTTSYGPPQAAAPGMHLSLEPEDVEFTNEVTVTFETGES